jgi:hypothetical protein
MGLTDESRTRYPLEVERSMPVPSVPGYHDRAGKRLLFTFRPMGRHPVAEDHAVVGGSSEFMAAFRRFYPRWPLDMDAFASCWSEYARSRNTDVTWLSAYIDYIYK